MTNYDVVIIGGGVAGLACAAELRRLGVSSIRIIEREREAGGIPRHCGHWGFGLREFGWIRTGPDYARQLVDRIGDVELSLQSSVLSIEREGVVTLNNGAGPEKVRGSAIVLAMGAREAPRSARLISGVRSPQVMNTGTLQQLIYLHDYIPFKHPVIIGSELVSFSALLTLRHAGIRARAMIEENARITARWPGNWIARTVFGVPIILNARSLRIVGDERVEGIEFDRGDGTHRIECDGVIVSGRFRPENSLLSETHLTLDGGSMGPAIDQLYRCSDPQYFAAGNVLRAIETAGQCWREGRSMARSVVARLDGRSTNPDRIEVTCGGAIAYVYPQFIDRGVDVADPLMFKARVRRHAMGRLRVLADGKEVWSKSTNVLPERRIAWRAPERALKSARTIEVRMETS